MKITRKLLKTAAGIGAMAVIMTSVSRAQAGSAQPGIASLLSAVNSADAEVKALGAEKSLTAHDIHLVDVNKIANDGNRATIQRAIQKNAGPIGEMREHLQKNATIMSVLNAAGVSIGQVVAIDVDHGQEIHVFYQ
jgi:hypothetical protein